MAIEVLKGFAAHAYYHDLESLFYVLCWICTTQGGPSNTKRCFDYASSQLRRWNGEDHDSNASMESVGDAKLGAVLSELAFEEAVSSKFDDYFTPIIPCVLELRELLFSAIAAGPRDVKEFQKLIRADPQNEYYETRLPLRLRDPARVFKSFIRILEEGVESLPSEHRTIHWMRLTPAGHSETSTAPEIEEKRVADMKAWVPVDDKPLQKALAQTGRGIPTLERRTKGRSVASASDFVVPMSRPSRGKKRTRDADSDDPQSPSPASGSSKRQKSGSQQVDTQLSVRLAPSTPMLVLHQGTSNQSSANPSSPRTPPEQPSNLFPPVQVGELNSRELLKEESSK